MIFKEKFEDYSESEFLEFLRALYEAREEMSADEYDAFVIRGVLHFEKLTQHPDQSDLIFYPKAGCESTPEDVLRVIKEWRALNNKPGLKPE